MPVQLQNILYYAAIFFVVGGLIIGVTLALRARREAREGVDLTSESDMLSEFQRARDAGELDDAEFRRVRDLLIAAKSSRGEERRDAGPTSRIDDRPPATPPPEPPVPAESE